MDKSSSDRFEEHQSRLQSSADEIVKRGAIGIAARVIVPGAAEPILVAAGNVDLAGSGPLTGRELFPIASQSKMFTAAAILLLARSGAINLDEPVSKYVANVPAVDSDATIDQFLNHTSGIGNFIHAMTTLPHPWPQMSYDDLMSLARMHGRQFKAGTRLEYNNTDVVVLAKLCETVSGMRMGEYLQRHLFTPLKMSQTHVADGSTWPRQDMARGYYLPSQGYDGAPIDVSQLPDFSIANAAANVVSSLDQLCAWMTQLRVKSNPTGLCLEDFVDNIVDQGSAVGHWFFPRTFGRGMESWVWAGRKVWGHRGSFFGYHSGTFIEPVSGVVFSMFLNMVTSGSFMRFIDMQAHDYMSFMESCCHAGIGSGANS